MSDTTQHTPADVRGGIIRASILPIEDEETMIAGLRAGAEAVERGELDAEDFAGIWSQYLRELFRRASSVVRERVAADADEIWYHWIEGQEDLAIAALRKASDEELSRFLDMLADWQRCPKPSDHDARRGEGGGDG